VSAAERHNLISVVQEWLFFGLPQQIFKAIEQPFSEAEFIEPATGCITTFTLAHHIRAWDYRTYGLGNTTLGTFKKVHRLFGNIKQGIGGYRETPIP
jgi:hypothetical protein